MKYLFFPGCTVPAKDPAFEASFMQICDILGIEIVREPNFHCCAPIVVSSVNYDTALAMSARNLCLAEEKKLDIITLCNGCFKNLRKVNKKLKESEEDRKRINAVLKGIGKQFKGTIDVKHFVQVLNEPEMREKIKANIKRPLTDMVFGSFYGCHLTRPHNVTEFDDPEIPRSIDEIVELLGAKTIDYEGKYVCCGGSLKGFDDDAANAIAREKLASLKENDVDGLVLVCPMCYFTFDLGQFELQRKLKETFDIAPIHLPELLGIAFGLDAKDLGINLHRIKAKKITEKLKAKA